MGKVVLELIPESPLRVGGVRPKENFLSTVGYIPGSVLRGTLAEWFRVQDREGDIVPVVSEMRFGNLFPAPREAHYALPLPLTALECKLHGGFRTEGGHGIRDSLLVACVYEELERLGARLPRSPAFPLQRVWGAGWRGFGDSVHTHPRDGERRRFPWALRPALL